MGEVRRFYRSEAEWGTLAEQLKQTPCPHCQVVGTLIRHGYLRGYDDTSPQRKTIHARRIFCSNRNARRGCNRAAAALCLAASSLYHSHGALGGYFRRMKSRLGAPKAVTATAHKLARMIYYSLRFGIQYVRQSQEVYEAQQRERLIANLKRRARLLGLQVMEPAPVEVASTGKGGSTETAAARK